MYSFQSFTTSEVIINLSKSFISNSNNSLSTAISFNLLAIKSTFVIISLNSLKYKSMFFESKALKSCTEFILLTLSLKSVKLSIICLIVYLVDKKAKR